MTGTSPRLRPLAALLAAAALAGCRAHTPKPCFPERGAEVWVERHYPQSPGSRDTSTAAGVFYIRLVADSGSQPTVGRQAIIAVLPDGPSRSGASAQVSERGEARLGPLTPGTYSVRLREILYVGIDRRVDVQPGERVELEVRMRHAAYCLGPVVRT